MPPALAIKTDVSSLRRFQVPDLDRHRAWMIGRLKVAYPHLNDANLVGWIRNVIYSPEYLFLYQDNSAALFQVLSSHTLQPEPIVQERFVFCEDKENPEHTTQAAEFYAEAKKWAKHQGASTLIVEELSDVPHEMIKERIGRLLPRQQVFHKIDKVE